MFGELSPVLTCSACHSFSLLDRMSPCSHTLLFLTPNILGDEGLQSSQYSRYWLCDPCLANVTNSENKSKAQSRASWNLLWDLSWVWQEGWWWLFAASFQSVLETQCHMCPKDAREQKRARQALREQVMKMRIHREPRACSVGSVMPLSSKQQMPWELLSGSEQLWIPSHQLFDVVWLV